MIHMKQPTDRQHPQSSKRLIKRQSARRRSREAAISWHSNAELNHIANSTLKPQNELKLS